MPTMSVCVSLFDNKQLCGRLLHLAVEFDAPACVWFLLAHDRNAVDWHDPAEAGQTASQLANEWGRDAILQILLLANGASGSNSCER